jgi:hypothetical protein
MIEKIVSYLCVFVFIRGSPIRLQLALTTDWAIHGVFSM